VRVTNVSNAARKRNMERKEYVIKTDSIASFSTMLWERILYIRSHEWRAHMQAEGTVSVLKYYYN